VGSDCLRVGSGQGSEKVIRVQLRKALARSPKVDSRVRRSHRQWGSRPYGSYHLNVHSRSLFHFNQPISQFICRKEVSHKNDLLQFRLVFDHYYKQQKPVAARRTQASKIATKTTHGFLMICDGQKPIVMFTSKLHDRMMLLLLKRQM